MHGNQAKYNCLLCNYHLVYNGSKNLDSSRVVYIASFLNICWLLLQTYCAYICSKQVYVIIAIFSIALIINAIV